MAMDRFRQMSIFVQVARMESFARAADALRLPRSSVSTAVKRLESNLGVQLLHRTTRSVRLSLDGREYLTRCENILQALEEADAEVAARSTRIAGRLRVDMPTRIARLLVIPRLGTFFERYPDIDLQLGVSDAPEPLVSAGIDCAIRVGALRDSELVCSHIRRLRQGNYASPAYLREYGVPRGLEDLQQHRMVNYESPFGGRKPTWAYTDGEVTRHLEMASPVTVNNAEAYIAAALEGFGLIQAPSYDMRRHERNGELVEVLPEYRAQDVPMTALFTHRSHLSRRVRAFVAWMREIASEAMRASEAAP